jgi:hypothetical protein
VGYFSNGSEGDWYENKYCAKCANFIDEGMGQNCPILELHAIYNYDQHDKTKDTIEFEWSTNLRTIVGLFIPRVKIGDITGNGMCKMYLCNKPVLGEPKAGRKEIP